MAAPETSCDLDRIVECIRWLLHRITHANGYHTDGIVVDLAGDPRVMVDDRSGAQVNRIEQFNRLGAGVSIQVGDMLQDPTGGIGATVGGTSRRDQQIQIHLYQVLLQSQASAGIKLERIHANLRDDIESVIYLDARLQRAHATLHAADATFGERKPSCIGMKVNSWARMESSYPYAYSVGSLVFPTDWFTPGPSSGTPARGWD